MKPITTSLRIDAPLELVFQTVSDVSNFRQAVPHITKVEFLTDQQVGAGTKFRETRVMKGREQSVVLEVAEYVKNDRVRMISDEGGTIWDTVFSVWGDDASATLEMQMDIRPYQLLSRLFTPLIRGMVAKAVQSDMDAVKSYCESQHA